MVLIEAAQLLCVGTSDTPNVFELVVVFWFSVNAINASLRKALACLLAIAKNST